VDKHTMYIKMTVLRVLDWTFGNIIWCEACTVFVFTYFVICVCMCVCGVCNVWVFFSMCTVMYLVLY
jgi:hypothetical protein